MREITKLPSQVSETSGITAFGNNFIWTHNDSGNEPVIYQIDTFANILRKVFIKNAVNIDWEDISNDGDSNIFIGDFGNNDNNRKDLKIYMISNPVYLSSDTAIPKIIEFYYSNQQEFPPSASNKNFDAEAMIYFNKFIYLFTKNYTSPFTGYTYMYKLPAIEGKHKAELIDSFKTGDGFKELWWVTSAALSPDNKKLVLLSSDKIFVFYEFTKDKFFKGKLLTVDLGFISQKEAISFVNNDDIYITDEYHQIFDGMKLYEGSLKNIIKTSKIGVLKELNKLVDIEYNDSGIIVSLKNSNQNLNITLIDFRGRIIGEDSLNKNNYTSQFLLKNGLYYLILTNEAGHGHLIITKY
ncbi:MAG: hypothetical protein IT243_05580 [Bacteroidia bacterium]|nr:hypothetical protein [Bacteroidia bacterium]